MDKLVKLALVLGALLAGVGVFHYYVIFLPGIERAKQEQVAARESTRQEQAAAEKRDAAARESTRQAAYWACKADARRNYDADWANACKTTARERQNSLLDCRANQLISNERCERAFAADPSSDECTLPAARADHINALHKEAQEKCLTEAKTGL